MELKAKKNRKGKYIVLSELDSIDEVVVEYECSKCPATFEENMDDLLQHYDSVHGNMKKQSKCFNCEAEFNEEKEFQKHVFSCQGTSLQETNPKPFHCSFCDYKSIKRRNLNAHIGTFMADNLHCKHL